MSVSQHQEKNTPWQKVFAKFGLSQRSLGKELGRDGAKINRAIHDKDGLINGRDQKKLIDLAKRMKIDLTADDLTP